MKSKNDQIVKIAVGVFAACFLMYGDAFAQLSDAADRIEQEVSSVTSTAKSICGGIALVAGVIGLVMAAGKSNVEGEQASKQYIKWLVGAGFFAVCFACLELFFDS
ncbi:hypothetical protein [Parapedobacter sp. 10938]|uniref:hypothetical protein n=1 Tax=Parapedobacter flavus TaxID=3110225 RepID=UPI002DBF538E|nr:hypothetical protein [Parapedobacter sp. 10938]MEC3881828.1 hypothetical protein [Parapedobacter sp. 10938]